MTVKIYIDRSELRGWTDMTLSRSKNALTGELSVGLFMGGLPDAPVLLGADRGREVLVYIGGHLVFTGIIDRRRDAGSMSIDNGGYSVTLTCRGKTKTLVDSSHRHPTCTMLRPTTRGVVETLLAPFGVEIDWGAADLSLDKIRFRDGGRVVDELQRIAEQAGLYIHEGRDGKLRVSDGAGAAQGEPLVLGKNILQFSADQADDPERSEILVKGQRTEVGIWGNDAVIPTMDNAIDAVVSRYTPITVQLYGNATPELLARRTEYEANRRSSAAKKINLDVFHVQQPSGMPWDIGDIHYVEIPPAGIYGMFEVTDLTYNVDADQTLKTSLTLSPAPTAYGRDRGGFLSALPEIDTLAQEALQRAGAAGAAISAALWSGPALTSIALPTLDLPQTPAAQFLGGLLAGLGAPPLTISEEDQ